MDSNLKKFANFFKFWCYVFQESSRNSLLLALSDKIQLIRIFVVALQKHFVYDWGLKVMILSQNWPKTAESSWHCPFKVAAHCFWYLCFIHLFRWKPWSFGHHKLWFIDSQAAVCAIAMAMSINITMR